MAAVAIAWTCYMLYGGAVSTTTMRGQSLASAPVIIMVLLTLLFFFVFFVLYNLLGDQSP
jgi:hypothetical protein